MASRGKSRPDVQSTLELMYLRILGRVKDRPSLAKGTEGTEESPRPSSQPRSTKIMDKAEKPGLARSESPLVSSEELFDNV